MNIFTCTYNIHMYISLSIFLDQIIFLEQITNHKTTHQECDCTEDLLKPWCFFVIELSESFKSPNFGAFSLHKPGVTSFWLIGTLYIQSLNNPWGDFHSYPFHYQKQVSPHPLLFWYYLLYASGSWEVRFSSLLGVISIVHQYSVRCR